MIMNTVTSESCLWSFQENQLTLPVIIITARMDQMVLQYAWPEIPRTPLLIIITITTTIILMEPFTTTVTRKWPRYLARLLLTCLPQRLTMTKSSTRSATSQDNTSVRYSTLQPLNPQIQWYPLIPNLSTRPRLLPFRAATARKTAP